MELTVLSVPDCPNLPLLEERLATVLSDWPGTTVIREVIADPSEAARLGMHGSPTLLVNGADPFARPGTPAAVACRMYPSEDGRLEGAPSVAALRRTLREAAQQP
jgi:hypothetical protein